MIKLSKTSKMPAPSWSLPAVTTCPGAFTKENGKRELVDVCKGCYAAEGFYRMAAAASVREHNMQDWQRDAWADDMVAELDNYRYFRWFDSGDCYKLELANKILDVMQRTPHTKHWLPTRMHKFAPFADVFEKMKALPNVVVRPSGDKVDQTGEELGSFVVSSVSHVGNAHLCKAYENAGKCGTCRACWSKDVPQVAYMAHGQSMKKVIRLALVAA